ncbi:hypothetical protein [Actinacidiphila acididurans]|uniref:hypothetical protein n=1 Tax=Actinacidiphila acididurans TaxID=2784346 RepID=UPI001F25D16A|nr:hypothetical protein [Actinacidiphila acididurans]
MSAVRIIRSVLVASAAFAGLVAVPAQAHGQIPVACSEDALVKAVTAANAVGGDTLALAPFCTYTLTSAHGSASDGPVGLPPVTTPITLLGMGVTIERSPSAPAFRLVEVDGPADVPATDGQLTATSITFRGGKAMSPYPGGGIANRGGGVFLTSSTVTGNTAVAGGGIYNDNGGVQLIASSVTANSASVSGGGIYNNSGPVNVLTSVVSGNTPDNCAPAGSVQGCTG